MTVDHPHILVDAHMEVAAAGKIEPDKLAAILEPMDRSKFLTATGEVDKEKVTTFVASITAKPFPNLGQGTRTMSGPSSVQSGFHRYQEKHT